MTTIQGIGSQPKQQLTIPLGDGTRASVYLEYRQQQTGWYMNVIWNDWELDGLRVTASPNMLRQWQNVIPFGLACITAGNVEPLNISDFSTSVATLLLLNQTDISAVNAAAYPGT